MQELELYICFHYHSTFVFSHLPSELMRVDRKGCEGAGGIGTENDVVQVIEKEKEEEELSRN